MSASGLEGYHGEILRRLKNANAEIGSIIRITTKSGEVFEGTLFPRSEYTDPSHIVLKLKNGYNIGIHYDKAGFPAAPTATTSPSMRNSDAFSCVFAKLTISGMLRPSLLDGRNMR